MANANLQGTVHEIPEEVLKHLSATYQQLAHSQGANGLKRLKGLLDRKTCSYEQLKRIKNYFDHYNPKTDPNGVSFALNGGEAMKNWVNSQLETMRRDIYNSRKLANDTAMVQQNDVTPDDMNPEVKNKRTVVSAPDFMTSNDLMEQINKMKQLIKSI